MVLEIGAGTAIPTIREMTIDLANRSSYVTAIRINPAEPQIDFPHISLPVSGLQAIERIEKSLRAARQ